ncbi:MAG: hypothetical protein WC236_13040 [Gallionellaceae bacterium]|jgi:hypothetical protein
MKSKDAHRIEMEAQLKAFDAWKDLQDENELHPRPPVTAQKTGAKQPEHAGSLDPLDTMNEVLAEPAQSWSQVRESADCIWDCLKAEFSGTRVKIK